MKRTQSLTFIFLIALLIFSIAPSVQSQIPVPEVGYEITSLDPTVDLLSGMWETEDGIAVCDRGAGKLLLIQEDASVQILIDNLDTPIDVQKLDREWIILQEEAGSLIAVDEETHTRRILADGFEHPSAFTLDENNQAYLVEFESGFLFRIDLATGEITLLEAQFSNPADILYLESNRMAVADQYNLDGKGGAIYWIDASGKIVDFVRNITDPSGLAQSQDGNLYATTFFTRGNNSSKSESSGGIVRVKKNGKPETIIENLNGPTSLLWVDRDVFMVLEEPTDSLFHVSSDRTITSWLEGFSQAQCAARLPNGDTAILERGQVARLRIASANRPFQTWAESPVSFWEYSILTADGLGNVYLSDPFYARILVFDAAGTHTQTVEGIVPYLSVGIPTGGFYAFSGSGKSVTLTMWSPQMKTTRKVDFRMDSQPLAGYATSDNEVILSLENGSVIRINHSGEMLEKIVSPRNREVFSSIVPDNVSAGALWLLDETNHWIVRYTAEGGIQRAVKIDDSGILLPDANGVLFISQQGKRFLIHATSVSVDGWFLQ